jgi:transcriptional regulator with XRE-family HTH domain
MVSAIGSSGVITVPSSRAKPNLRRQIYLALVGKVEGQIRDVFTKKAETDGLTQAQVAAKLGVGRSVVHRRLTGRTNMTVETLADMAWAIGACIEVDIYDPLERPEKNHVLAEALRVPIYTSLPASAGRMPSYPSVEPCIVAPSTKDVRTRHLAAVFECAA